MDSPPRTRAKEPSLPPVAGIKRPAPTLLPPFEPLSSSPGLPRLVKKARMNSISGSGSGSSSRSAYSKYPTPVPTSSTGILSSSPPLRTATGPRPVLQRTLSTATERVPLCAVPTIELNENGETLLMGRSSNSSHYQLSANRLISRVHVRARYIPSTEALEPNRIEIVCAGWNGLKLHCQGATWDLSKDDTFTSETENAEIMLDVQDARVRIQWPKKDRADTFLAGMSDSSSWDDSPRPAPRSHSRTHSGSARHGHDAPGAPGASALASSPLRRSARIASPESPTPAGIPASTASLQALLSEHLGSDDDDEDDGSSPIQIYEDASGDEVELPKQLADKADMSFATELADSFSSELSELRSEDERAEGDDDDENDINNPDEENDPIIHSFGPFGANLSNRLASFTHGSPKATRPHFSRVHSSDGSITSVGSVAETKKSKAKFNESNDIGLGITVAALPPAITIPNNVNIETVRNHLINQLAFSRLSSSPLSTILNNLPAEERRDLTRDGLRHIIEDTVCVGVIPRQGKDAAGQPLESEYYYIPDNDSDESRRAAVVDGLRKPSLRNCRKQHKQYYWKKPRTP